MRLAEILTACITLFCIIRINVAKTCSYWFYVFHDIITAKVGLEIYPRSIRLAVYCLSFCRPAALSKLEMRVALLRFDALQGGKNPAQ